jgi:hypothetical protein
MQINIHLNKTNKRLLKKISKTVIPHIKSIRFKKKLVVLSGRGLFSKKVKIPVVEFILLYLTDKINSYSTIYEMGQIFPVFQNIDEAIVYFSEFNEDVIQHIYNNYFEITLFEDMSYNFEEEPVCIKPVKIEIVESRETKKLFTNTVNNYKRIIEEVILRSELPLKIVHLSKEALGRAPPTQYTVLKLVS